MKKMFISFFGLFFCLGFFLPSSTFADGKEIPFDANGKQIAPPEDAGSGEEVITDALYFIVTAAKAIAGTIAILTLVWSAILLVTQGGEEEKVKEARQGMTWALLGLVLLLMMDTAVDVFYMGGETLATEENMNASLTGGQDLIMSAVSWFQALATIMAVVYLVISGYKLIISLGEGEELSTQKNAIIWLGVGLITMALNNIFITEVFYKMTSTTEETVNFAPSATRGVSEIMTVMKYFLRFLGIIVFLAFVYGGAQMVFAFGDEEKVESGKKLMKGAAIGVVVILTSAVIVGTFVSGSVGGG